MKISTSKNKYLYVSIGVLIIFVIWLISSFIIDNEIVLPKIDSVFIALTNLFKNIETYKIILFTLLRISISLVLGFFIGVALALIALINDKIYYIFSPFIKIMRALPIASIILIILIMFGMKGFNDFSFSPILVSILLVIPIFYEATYKGVKNIDSRLIDVAKLDTNSKLDLIRYSYIPLIRNEISISLSSSIGLSFKSMVMAEYISQANISIGYALLYNKTWLNYDYVFSWTIILIILSVIFEIVVFYIKRKVEK